MPTTYSFDELIFSSKVATDEAIATKFGVDAVTVGNLHRALVTLTVSGLFFRRKKHI